MNKLTKYAGIAGIVLGLGTGCIEDNNTTNNTSKSKYDTLTAKPISVAGNIGEYRGTVAIVVSLGNEKILCYDDGVPRDNNALATALVQAEIDDGDNEPIKLIGKYDGNKFHIDKLVVEQYEINL